MYPSSMAFIYGLHLWPSPMAWFVRTGTTTSSELVTSQVVIYPVPSVRLDEVAFCWVGQVIPYLVRLDNAWKRYEDWVDTNMHGMAHHGSSDDLMGSQFVLKKKKKVAFTRPG